MPSSKIKKKDMAKARKEGKAKRNRQNICKRSKLMKKNRELIEKIESSIK